MTGHVDATDLTNQTVPDARTAQLSFCGVRFDLVTTDAVLDICRDVTARSPFRYLVTPNVDHVVRLNQEPDVFEPLYASAVLSLCDSRILELLAKFKGVHLPVTPGSDLTARLLEDTIAPDEPLTVIGGDAEIISNIKARYGLKALHHYAPPMGLRHKPDEVAKAARFIADNPARFVFLCVGSPQQEMIAKAALDLGTATGLGLCVGASLDFLAGRAKRAPKWMQNLRLEWLFRLLSEPGRMWKRYLVEGPKIFALWLKWHKE